MSRLNRIMARLALPLAALGCIVLVLAALHAAL